MSGGVELKVVLVGGDEQEQSVLNGSSPGAGVSQAGSVGLEASSQAVIDSMEKLSTYVDQLVSKQYEPTIKRETREESARVVAKPVSAPDAKPDLSMLEQFVNRVLPSRITDALRTVGQMFRPASAAASVASDIGTATKAVRAAEAGAGAQALRGAGSAAGGAEAAAATRALATAGPVVAGLTVAVVAAKVQFDMLNNAVKTATGQLRDFSPDIQRVDAITEARRAQVSIQRAQEIGPVLANIQQSRDRLADSFDRTFHTVLVPILELVEKGVPILDAITAVINQTNEGIEAIAAGIKLLAVPITWQDPQQAWAAFAKELKEFLRPDEKKDDKMLGPDKFMRSIMEGTIPQAPPFPPPRFGDFP